MSHSFLLFLNSESAGEYLACCPFTSPVNRPGRWPGQAFSGQGKQALGVGRRGEGAHVTPVIHPPAPRISPKISLLNCGMVLRVRILKNDLEKYYKSELIGPCYML